MRPFLSPVALPASAAGADGYASLRLPHGAAPTTNLTNGDLWTTTAGLYARINGATVGPFSAGGSPAGSTTQVQYNSSGAFGASANLTYASSSLFVSGGFIASRYDTTAIGYSPAVGGLVTATATGSGVIYFGGAAASADNFLSYTDVTLAQFTFKGGRVNALTGFYTDGSYYGNVLCTQKVVSSHTGALGSYGLSAGDVVAARGNDAGVYYFGLTNGGTKYLQWDGTNFVLAGGALTATFNAPGSAGEVLFNSSGSIGASANLTWSGSVLTVSGRVTTAASTTASASLRMPHGTAPTTPVNGDVWTTTVGLYARIDGATYAVAVNPGVPSAEGANRTLTNADNSKNLICTGSRTFTVNIGLITGFGCSFKGTVAFTGTATITDVRTTGATNPWCALCATGTDTYDIVGSKA